MTHYQLRYVLHPPSEDTGWMFMAEVPVLPGCQAWAATGKETVDILTSVAEEFIASYKAHGDELPDGVVSSESQAGSPVSYEQNSKEPIHDAIGPDSDGKSILVAA